MKGIRWLISCDTTKLVVCGMLLGILTGLFFGEKAQSLEVIGNAFIHLIQMVILPYVIVALIKGFGSFTPDKIKKIIKCAGIALLLMWIIVLTIGYGMHFSFPSLGSANFYSAALVTHKESSNILDTIIPSNPFSSIVNSAIPAIVIFSISIGMGLIKVKDKELILKNLQVLEDALANLVRAFFKLAPIGVFALVASAAGTFDVAQATRLQVFFYSYYVGAMLIALFVFPLLLRSFLPFTYREIFDAAKGPLILAFTSASSFIALPLLITGVQDLIAKRKEFTKENLEEATVIIPILFNFPMAGKLLCINFVMFIAWFYGKILSTSQEFLLIVASLINFFGDPEIALPNLLDLMKLPVDAFNLYVLSSTVTGYMETMTNAMSIFTVALLYVGLLSGVVKLTFIKLVSFFGKILLFAALVIFLLGLAMSYFITPSMEEQGILLGMHIEEPVPSKIIKENTPLSNRSERTSHLLDNIRQSKMLRVGFNPNSLPFAYYNSQGELVGFDIDMAHHLANSLKCEIEFIPFNYDQLANDLKSGKYDIAMSAVTINSRRSEQMDFTYPYLTLHLCFVVPGYLRKEFVNAQSINEHKDLIINVLKGSVYISVLKKYLPNVKIVEISDRKEFFEKNNPNTALFTSAEQGSAWSLLYPDYSVVIPEDKNFTDFISYAIPKGNSDLLYYLNEWIYFQQQNGNIQHEYDRWILGNDPHAKPARWSIMQDVLHW